MWELKLKHYLRERVLHFREGNTCKLQGRYSCGSLKYFPSGEMRSQTDLFFFPITRFIYFSFFIVNKMQIQKTTQKNSITLNYYKPNTVLTTTQSKYVMLTTPESPPGDLSHTLPLSPKVITSLFLILSLKYVLSYCSWFCLLKTGIFGSLLIYRFILHSRLCLIVCWRNPSYFTKVSCSLDFLIAFSRWSSTCLSSIFLNIGSWIQELGQTQI